ncbi:MAG: leucine-rich repeat domain-containing protein [Kiritimatiellae bacterium]|nr:leucine-rich repeat domain-containing protein [Kiritimatiellia bacterium]
MTFCAEAATETVNGIKWIYSVKDGKASLERGGCLDPAIPKSTSGAITIPSTLGGYPVTSIGDGAFDRCSSLTSVTIPNSVTSIGDLAFDGCSSLKSVTIPNSVTSIGDNAFSLCSSLKSVTIPNSVTSIGKDAFSACKSLKSVTIPNSVTSIGDGAFSGCKSLASVTIPNSVTSIGDWAFVDCSSLTRVTIPDSVTSIGGGAFSECKGLADLDGFIIIRGVLYGYCGEGKEVLIPNSVTSIGDWAFFDCSSLTSVTIPDSVTSIGGGAFRGCKGLADSDGFIIIRGVLYDYCGEGKEVLIPNSVTSIGRCAFEHCSSLTSVTIPNSVTSIGSAAFFGCKGLADSNGFIIIRGVLHGYCGEGGVVLIPDSVTNIGDWAFCGCESLTSVTIPNSVTSIRVDAFGRCGELTIYTDAGNSDRLRKMLENAGANVKEIIEQKAKEQEAEEQESRGIRWWFVLGCVGTVVVLVGPFFWIVRRKKKREGASANMKKKMYTGIVLLSFLLFFLRGVYAAPPAGADEILVGVTGYGDSSERYELMTNGQCNLWVQWGNPKNLMPEHLGEWYDWAKKNRIRVMTIYGRQNESETKRLKEAWGELYLGNNIGEYAGFLYQDEKSYFKNWPKLSNLKEAHEWLVGNMLAAPKKAQLKRSVEGREPQLFSTSGSPLACYELDGGIDYICNEMYAVGCGNLAYATAEARGAAKRRGINWWSAWLAHEWQTCWPRVPYAVPQKMDSLEVGLKEMWLMGTSMMVLESGSQSTQAHPYTPADEKMDPFNSPKQEYHGEAPKAYRRTIKKFYEWTKTHPRANGMPEVPAALALGNYDGYVGMTWNTFAIFGQHHLAATNANWRVGAPEFTWEAIMEEFYPRPTDSLKPFANGWLGGSPHGQVDVVNIDDALKVEQLKDYKVLIFGGWNTMTGKIAETLREYVSQGGQVVLCTPQLSSRIDREYANYTASDIVQAVPGVKVKDVFLSEDILMVKSSAPEFLKAAYPAHLSAKLRVADVELGENVEIVATMGKKPYLVKANCGKGAFWMCLAWDYPAARREAEEFPSFRAFRLEFWKTLCRGLVRESQPFLLGGEDADYINWSIYKDRIYLLNTDCVSPRKVKLNGVELELAPKELKEIFL